MIQSAKSKDAMLLLLKMSLLAICMLFFTSCSSSRIIVHNLDEKDANEILVYLSGRGVDASKVVSAEAGGGGGGGSKVPLWDIQVPTDQVTESMSLLNQAGLPRRRSQSLLGIFAGGGLVPSELQEKIRYQAGLAEQIASTIRKIDGILDAEVQISFPEEDPLNPGKKKGKITASVYAKHNGVLDDPNLHLIPKIKRLVASSITGLDYDDVTVIGERAPYASTAYSPGRLATSEEQKEYVSIWSIVIAKESVSKFRVLFFSFIIGLLLLTIVLVWLAWKLLPLLNKYGGIRELFHIHPIPLEPKAEISKEDAEKEAAAKAAEAKKASEEEGGEDKGIDET